MNDHSTFRKVIVLTLVLCNINALLVRGQVTESWTVLPNSPQSQNRFDDIYFVTDSLGWAVNDKGEIYNTTDAGNNWQMQLSGGGYFRSVEFLNKDTGFAGNLNSGLYKTVNGGQEWHNIIDSLPVQVDGICGMSHVGNTIYACGIFASPAYVLKSTDAGVTWTFSDLSNYADALVDCYFISKDTGFVCGSGALSYGLGIILKTEDGGSTWQLKASTLSGYYVWKLDFVTNQLAYASIESDGLVDSAAILKTIDGGNTWQKLNVTVNFNEMQGIGFLNDTLGWCGGWTGGMWQTSDGGITWEHIAVGNGFNRYFRITPTLIYAAGGLLHVYKPTEITSVIDYLSSNDSMPHRLLLNIPNPFSNTTTIRFELSVITRVRIEVFDPKGMRVCDEKPGFLSKGIHEYNFDFSNLPSGEYVVLLKTNERMLSQKIICQKGN
jgi:photosystem II stability/assembly factor-like uncharacterized protein